MLDSRGVKRCNDATSRADDVRPHAASGKQHGALQVELLIVAGVDFARAAEDVVERDVQSDAV